MHFKYKELKRPTKHGDKSSPVIPITLFGNDKNIDTVGLLDSGADVSAISKDLAELLGLDLKGKKTDVGGIGGPAEAVLSKVRVKVTAGKHESKTFQVPVFVILSDDMEDDFPVIIGRAGFFEKFKVEFVEAEGRITLTEYNRKL